MQHDDVPNLTARYIRHEMTYRTRLHCLAESISNSIASTAAPSHATSRSRGALRPSLARHLFALDKRGRGECRVPNAPAAWCAHIELSMRTSIHSACFGGARTTRLRRPQGSALVSRTACVHRIPPHVRDDRETPLMERRDGGSKSRISEKRK